MISRTRILSLEINMILVTYYEGAYRPTLRIDLRSIDRLRDVKAIFEKLSSGGLHRFFLNQLPSSVMNSPIRAVGLFVRLDDCASVRHKKITCFTGKDGAVTFEWTQTPDQWATTYGLTEGLEQAGILGVSAHQYLTDESSDDVLVELALNEL